MRSISIEIIHLYYNRKKKKQSEMNYETNKMIMLAFMFYVNYRRHIGILLYLFLSQRTSLTLKGQYVGCHGG